MVFVFEGVVVDLNEVELKNRDKNEADAAYDGDDDVVDIVDDVIVDVGSDGC